MKKERRLFEKVSPRDVMLFSFLEHVLATMAVNANDLTKNVYEDCINHYNSPKEKFLAKRLYENIEDFFTDEDLQEIGGHIVDYVKDFVDKKYKGATILMY